MKREHQGTNFTTYLKSCFCLIFRTAKMKIQDFFTYRKLCLDPILAQPARMFSFSELILSLTASHDSIQYLKAVG